MNTITIGNLFRWVHILSAVAWFGEVLVVIFVLVPSVRRMEGETRSQFLQAVFPRVFRLASVLSLTAVLAGIGIYLSRFEWTVALNPLVDTRWGQWILVGAALATVLTLFHFFVESLFAPVIRSGMPPEDIDRTIKVLTIAPRVGVFVLVGAALSMMYAARGL